MPNWQSETSQCSRPPLLPSEQELSFWRQRLGQPQGVLDEEKGSAPLSYLLAVFEGIHAFMKVLGCCKGEPGTFLAVHPFFSTALLPKLCP